MCKAKSGSAGTGQTALEGKIKDGIDPKVDPKVLLEIW